MRFQLFFTLVMTTIALAGCAQGPLITVINRSAFTISNVVVSGRNFSQSMATLASGTERSVTVHPQGESDVRLTFETGDRQIDSGKVEYFEDSSMYRVLLIIGSDLQVSSSTNINGYGDLP